MTSGCLDRAYRRAVYRVRTESGSLDLTISKPSGALRRLLAGRGVQTAALLTACNPGSSRRHADANRAAQAELLQTVAELGYLTLPAVALDPDGVWPDEDSVLVLGMEPAAAISLARRFGQNALVHIGPGATPELVWVAGPPAAGPVHA